MRTGVFNVYCPRVGQYWKIENGSNSLYAIITAENPWCVKYFEPSVKGKFQVLNDTVFDVFRKDLYEKVPTPELKRQGKSRMYYLFQK